MRIAAAQLRCPWLDPAAGTAKVLDFLGKAAAEDVGSVEIDGQELTGCLSPGTPSTPR
ncbi:hypothetical protein [Nonomuraea sp. NPDC048826]|uniref:hypothetical protein n=1 Tax=Nonomuraea sp. NPDC048826 TaxID=3364347 RepID=UPI003710F4EE